MLIKTLLLPLGLFTILSYVNKSAEIPAGWNKSDPYIISATADQVKLLELTHNPIP